MLRMIHALAMVAFTVALLAASEAQYVAAAASLSDETIATSFASSSPRQAPVTPAPTAMKQFRDEKFGFTLELPDTWAYRVTPNKDYLFEGPQGTDAFEVSVILQFVAKSANPQSSAAAQLEGVAADLVRAANAEIKTRDAVSVGGQPAPFVTTTYTAQNSAGEAVPFAHTQIVVDHGDYYYLISYSAPTAIYQKFLSVFQHAVESFAFTF